MGMQLNLLLFFTLLFFPIPLISDETEWLAVWNVGQGQWVTYKTNSKCLHIDMGGEKIPNSKLLSQCSKKENYLYITHYDWDHINLINKIQFIFSKICLNTMKINKITKRKEFLLKKIKPCLKSFQEIHEIFFKYDRKIPINSNDQSRVFTLQNKFLVPGDSTKKMEKIWIKRISPFNHLSHLVLGHHGSQTSTSKALVTKLQNLKQAIVSARFQRYGHPHKSVTDRLKKNGISLIKTEDWGHLVFKLH